MFILLLPLALALVVVSVLGFAGFGPLTDERRAGRDGLLGGLGPAVGVLAGGVLLVLVAITTIGLGGRSGGDAGSTAGPSPSPTGSLPVVPTRPAPVAAPTPAATPTPTVAATPGPSAGPEVRVEAEAGDGATFPASYDVADGLDPETVLTMVVAGFDPFAAAVAEQCTSGATRLCTNSIPVQFDERGEARFQYLISDDFPAPYPVPGGCRADAAPCTVDISSYDRDTEQTTRASVQTIFGDELPAPGRIEVSPSTELSLDGEPVTVEVSDYPPGVEVTAMLCAAPDAYGPRCGAPGPTATLRVGPDGAGRTTLRISRGPVGPERAPCSRGDDCGVSVVSDDVFARAPVVPITFAAPPGAAYDPLRLALGLGLALVLLLVATVLLIRTDWAPVGEAAAPEIDDAEYADLDAIIAALPPEDEDELASVP